MALEISIRILCNLKFWLLSIVLLDISRKKKLLIFYLNCVSTYVLFLILRLILGKSFSYQCFCAI